MRGYEAFYEMVKVWTVRDYKTQSIKSEVIIDMLISGFIEAMVAAHFKTGAGQVKCLAKEFPIRIHDKDRRNARVDYLVKVGDILYFVELKTTNESLNGDQKERMENVIKKHEKEKGMNRTGKDFRIGFFLRDVIDCQKRNSAAEKKYNFTLETMKEKLSMEDDTERPLIEERLNNARLEILYICLRKSRASSDFFAKEKTECLFLEDYLKEDREETERFRAYLRAQDEQDQKAGREHFDRTAAWDRLKPVLEELREAAVNLEGE